MVLRKKKEDIPKRSDMSPKTSMPTYSYRSVRANEDRQAANRDPKKVSTKRLKIARNIWVEKFGLIILAVVIVICLFSILYLSSTPNVVMLSDDNNPLFTSSRVAVGQEAQRLLSSSLLNKNKITVNTHKITDNLEEDFPMYSDISISLPFIDHHPVIYLTPAQPEVSLTNVSGQYVLNSNGQIMLRSINPKYFNDLNIPNITYQLPGYLSVGEQILTSSEVSFIQTVIYELNTRAVTVSKITLLQATSELDVYITNEPYYVKFNLENNNPKQQAGSFLATQHYLKEHNITPSKYIDVRVDGRVYYQ
jgi:hypothetical protein